MTSMLDLFLAVACSLSQFTALLKGFLFLSITVRSTVSLVFNTTLPAPALLFPRHCVSLSAPCTHVKKQQK